KNQLDRLVPVHHVVDMTLAGNAIERELAMVKVKGKGDNRVEALRLADAFRARPLEPSSRERRWLLQRLRSSRPDQGVFSGRKRLRPWASVLLGIGCSREWPRLIGDSRALPINTMRGRVSLSAPDQPDQ